MKAEDNKRADLDDQLSASRQKQKDLTTTKGRLEAEAKVRGCFSWDFLLSYSL